ncbi:MAG: ATP-binding cassette domain-containing protein [Deltaproteobacteria bacterium]|jgi:putative ABC transport system ATP-binding protein|nr:ATP-binding cassette domain-containing protein [Deltaproteobacteria bacterium]MBW2536854.1 ATP-binding cassette domain-containing protein [Deltaproteobacteria bacterium]
MTAARTDSPPARPASEPGAAIFEVCDLGVSISGKPLLERVNLSLATGQVIAVTGSSGSGKSTLLRTLAGLIDPAAGTMRLRGAPPDRKGMPAWRSRVVYTAQRPVLPEPTVQENLAKPFDFRSLRGRRFSPERAEQALRQLALPVDCLASDPRKLSEGQQQRVGLLRALLIEPEVLLLDEPTSALDPDTSSQVEAYLRAHLERTGAAALVVTHDPQQASRLGDLRLSLDEHRSAASGEGRGEHG